MAQASETPPVAFASLSDSGKSLLLDCARLSWMAYSDQATVDARRAAAPNADYFQVLDRVTSVQFVECKACDAQCYLVHYKPPPAAGLGTEPVLAICARGTTSLMDWMCDAEVEQTVFKDCNQQAIGRVHAGFNRQFVGLFKVFDDQIMKHMRAGGKLLCTGHSLGAAIATIAALNYASAFPAQVWFADFGGPRAGDAVFARAFDRAVQLRLRVKNAADPVVSVVPPVGYVHVGAEVHLGPTDPYPDVPVLLDVGDHDIAKYTRAVAAPDACKESKPAATRNWLLQAFGLT